MAKGTIMMTAAGTFTIITWWLEIGLLAFAGGIAIGLGFSWLFVSKESTDQEPGALSAWPPILGALKATRTRRR